MKVRISKFPVLFKVTNFKVCFCISSPVVLYHPCAFRLRFFLSFGLQAGSIRSSSSSGLVSSAGLISSCSSSVDGSLGTSKGFLFEKQTHEPLSDFIVVFHA